MLQFLKLFVNDLFKKSRILKLDIYMNVIRFTLDLIVALTKSFGILIQFFID